MADTSERTFQDAAFAHLGEIDITVRVHNPQTFEILPITPEIVAAVSFQALIDATNGLVDGLVTAVERDLPVTKVKSDPDSPLGFRPVLAEPEVSVVGLDLFSLKDARRGNRKRPVADRAAPAPASARSEPRLS